MINLNVTIEKPNLNDLEKAKYDYKIEKGELIIPNVKADNSRHLLYMIFTIVLLSIILTWDLNGFYKNTIENLNWTFNFNQTAEQKYINNSFNKDTQSLKEYKKSVHHKRYKLISNLLIILFYLITARYIINYKGIPPIRFNKKHRIIYTWKNNEIYYLKLDHQQPTLLTSKSFETYTSKAKPIIIYLSNKKGKKKEFLLGSAFGTNGDSHLWLAQIIWGYLSRKNYNTDDQWLKDKKIRDPWILLIHTVFDLPFWKEFNLDSEPVQNQLSDVLSNHTALMPNDNLFNNEEIY